MDTINIIFSVIVLIISVVIHEVSHGYAAFMLGDRTAEYEGRLTLNPLKHLDPIGSVIVPILLYMTAGFAFGWAKPVPYNPYNLRNQRWGEAWVAFAGPLSNIIIAVLGGLAIRLSGMSFGPAFLQIMSLIVLINLSLAIFNLVPIPPLDGSKILFSVFPNRLMRFRANIERYGLILSLVFILFVWHYFFPVILKAFSFLTGVGV
jgi:Zn-dependent protease